MATDTDTYTLVVIFSRSRSDDDAICKQQDRTPNAQLAAELQDAADEGIIAGSFEVWRQ